MFETNEGQYAMTPWRLQKELLSEQKKMDRSQSLSQWINDHSESRERMWSYLQWFEIFQLSSMFEDHSWLVPAEIPDVRQVWEHSKENHTVVRAWGICQYVGSKCALCWIRSDLGRCDVEWSIMCCLRFETPMCVLSANTVIVMQWSSCAHKGRS